MYAIDVIAYTITKPINFLSKRQKLYGPNFAALGRVIVGEYDIVSQIIQSPQRRGKFLGRAKLIPSRVPKYFPLFLSDADAGGDEAHAIIHQYFWETLIPPALERTSDPIFDGYVKNMVALMKKSTRGGVLVLRKEELNTLTRTMVVKYIFHALFGISLSKAQVKDAITLLFSPSPFTGYVTGAMKPIGTPFLCFQCSRNKLITSLSSAIFDSPALENYVPSDATLNMSKQDLSEMLLGIAGIAGCVGTTSLCTQVITGIPANFPIQLDDPKAIMLAVLEAARIRSPVNNVNVILDNPLTLTINEKEYTLPEGTVVAASIGLASIDPKQFENPTKFDPTRANLVSSSLNFNHVGFNAVGSGTRQCPGRNIAMKIASTLLIEIREDGKKSYGGVDA